MASDKQHLKKTLHDFLDLILILGACAVAVWVVYLVSCIVLLHAVPHIYNPQVSLRLEESPVKVMAASGNTQFVATGDQWKVQLPFFENASLGSVAVQLGWLLLRPGTMLVIVWLIRAILISIEAGAPFHDLAPSRLRAIGWFVIAGSVGRAVEDWLVMLYIKSRYVPSKGAFVVSLDLSSMLWGSAVGVMVIILADVFRYGHAMRREQELTV